MVLLHNLQWGSWVIQEEVEFNYNDTMLVAAVLDVFSACTFCAARKDK